MVMGDGCSEVGDRDTAACSGWCMSSFDWNAFSAVISVLFSLLVPFETVISLVDLFNESLGIVSKRGLVASPFAWPSPSSMPRVKGWGSPEEYPPSPLVFGDGVSEGVGWSGTRYEISVVIRLSLEGLSMASMSVGTATKASPYTQR